MSSEQVHYAYGPEHKDLEAVMRLHAVKRWHMIDTTRHQTLAEHSANVAMLAYLIACTTPGMFFGPGIYLLQRGLLHDLGEVFVGDIPSHTKRRLSGVKELEAETLPDIFGIPPDTTNDLLIKLCDLADGIRFIRLHGVDVTARHARLGLEDQLVLRKADLREQGWPPEVIRHVMKKVMFYAYEEY